MAKTDESKPAGKKCMHCGTVNRPDAMECSNFDCRGTAFEGGVVETYTAKVCLGCQMAFHKDDAYCPRCGAKLINIGIPKCGQCGGRMMEFCAGCGRKQEEVPEEKSTLLVPIDTSGNSLKRLNLDPHALSGGAKKK